MMYQDNALTSIQLGIRRNAYHCTSTIYSKAIASNTKRRQLELITSDSKVAAQYNVSLVIPR